MPPYDSEHYHPPAPLATVTLSTQDRKTSLSDVVMQIDSGADASVIPELAVARLGLEVEQQRGYELVAFDGSKKVARSVQCRLIFLGRAFRGTFLVREGARGVLGRDVLNHIALVLDGPHLTWREEHAVK